MKSTVDHGGTTPARRRARRVLGASALLGAAAVVGCTPADGERRAADAAATAAGQSAASAASSDAAGGASAAAGAAATADAGGAVALFDGTGLGRWRGYKRQDAPSAWQARGDTLVFVPVSNKADRGDLVSRDQFGDFDLEYEWRVAPGANSGVMWRVSEDQDFPWQSGPEQQVLDDDLHLDGKIPSHRAGALYDLVVPPRGLTKPVGQFNQARVVARGGRVQLYLNGRSTADVDFASDSGRALVAGSKFGKMPRFAQNARGHIVLQDHGDTVYFRNVRVRPAGGAQ